MMQPRHPITKEYNSNPRHRRRWELTIKWLKQFDIKGKCLDCGDYSDMTLDLLLNLGIEVRNTEHNLDWFNDWEDQKLRGVKWDNVFIFEVIEHLMNPLLFLSWVDRYLYDNSTIFLSTPINRPKWMRNRELHFHEFNYNELVFLIETAGFKIVNEKRINCTSWKMITGFRPLLRFFGIDQNILLRLKKR